MMFKVLLLSLLLATSLAVELESDAPNAWENNANFSDEPGMINAGVSFAINENFFNKLLTDLLPNVLKLIGDEFNTTKVYELDLDMITLFISKPSLIINTINYDPDLTKANLYHENNSVGFHIVDSKVNLTLDYDVFTDPLLIDDIGKVDVGYEKLNLDITFGMGASKDDPSQFAIEVSQSSLSVDPKSVRIDLTNENDFNKLVVSVVNAILPPIANLVGTALSEYLQNLVDLVTGLVKWPLVIKDISVDLSFKEWPVVTNDTYLTISSVGKISLAEKDHPFVNTALLPQWVPDGKDFQVFISDYTIRSALATISQIDMDPLTITKKDTKIMSTSYLNSFFPGLSKEFGKNKDCKLDIRLSSDPLPELSITPKGIDTSTSVLMSLSWDRGSENFEEAFTFKVNAKIIAILDINERLTIKMKINDLKIKVTEIVNSNIGKIDIKKLNSIMSLLLNLIKTLVNTLLSRGIDLSIFLRNLPAALKDIHISPRDGYYLLMANPYFDTQSVPRLLELLAGDEGLLKSDRTHSEIVKKSLAKGLSAFYETFDKHTHLNRPGAAPLKALIGAFEIYQPLIARGEEAHRNME